MIAICRCVTPLDFISPISNQTIDSECLRTKPDRVRNLQGSLRRGIWPQSIFLSRAPRKYQHIDTRIALCSDICRSCRLPQMRHLILGKSSNDCSPLTTRRCRKNEARYERSGLFASHRVDENGRYCCYNRVKIVRFGEGHRHGDSKPGYTSRQNSRIPRR